jgi:alpha-glucosidase
LNLSHRPCYLTLQHQHIRGKVVLSTASELEGTGVTETIQLSGDEGIIVELAA